MIAPVKGERVEIRDTNGRWLPAVVEHVNEGAEPSFIVRVEAEGFARSVQAEDLREAGK